jgi:hypothetical protein
MVIVSPLEAVYQDRRYGQRKLFKESRKLLSTLSMPSIVEGCELLLPHSEYEGVDEVIMSVVDHVNLLWR